MATIAEHLPRRVAARLPFASLWAERRARTPLPRPTSYVVVVATVAVLNVVGLVMILSASSVAALSDYGSSWHFFDRQLVWALVAAAVFFLAARFDYRRWRRFTTPLLLVSAVLLLVVLVPGVGIQVDGSRRWLGSGPLRFQPTEVAKLALLVYCADLLTRRADQLRDWRRGVMPVVLVFATFALLVLTEPDLDSTIVLALVVLAALAVAGVPGRQLGLVAGLGAVATGVLAFAEPYRRARMLVFLDPWKDSSNRGYQIVQSLIATGSGGWGGVGLGAGRAKWMFLPNAHTDFIFAIIGEELGLVGCLLVVGLFVCFGLVGYRVALRAPDRFGMLVAAGVTTWVVGQAAINMAAVVGLLPVSGIPLPFLSSGGSALVLTMAAAGILANIARQSGRRPRPRPRPAPSRIGS